MTVEPGGQAEIPIARVRRCEPDALWSYVVSYFSDALTEVERGAVCRMSIEMKTPSGEGLEARLKSFRADSPECVAALADGREAFKDRVLDRLVAEAGEEVALNFCKACARLAKTPMARRCFHCGYDWH